MTWSQLEYFTRAATYVEAEDLLMALSIAHNPYTKQQAVGRLWRTLRGAMRAAKHGMPGMSANGDGRMIPLSGEALERQLGPLTQMLGPVKRVVLSPDDFAKRMRARP